MNDTCTWWRFPDSTYWETDCNAAYEFEDRGPFECEWKFCPFCGKAIVLDEEEYKKDREERYG